MTPHRGELGSKSPSCRKYGNSYPSLPRIRRRGGNAQPHGRYSPAYIRDGALTARFDGEVKRALFAATLATAIINFELNATAQHKRQRSSPCSMRREMVGPVIVMEEKPRGHGA
jgi:hypothetical protein